MSTIKVDTVRPVTTDASLTLQGDSSGSGVTGITIDSAGDVTVSGAFTSQGIDDNATSNALTLDSSSNLKFNSGYGSVATAYGCRAWVNFNGTGTVAIRASGNVSSITDNGGNGDYTVNFTTAMPDGNYSVAGSVGGSTASRPIIKTPKASGSFNANNFSLEVLNESTGSVFDTAYICLSVFR